MVIAQVTDKVNVCQYIKEFADDPHCLELIRFFGWHPDCHFSGLAILHALSENGEHLDIQRALRHLVDKGLVRTYIENNTPIYCLTDVEPLRQAALDIARMDWSQWQVMLRQSYAGIFRCLGKQPKASLSA